MIYFYVLLSLAVLNGVACQSEYYNSQVDSILSELSHDLISDGLSQVKIQDLSYNYLVLSANFMNGYIKNLSTIERSGNVNYKMLQANQTQMLSFQVKFDFLEFFYPTVNMYILLMSPVNNVNLTIRMETITMDLAVLLNRDFHDCSYYINMMTTTVGSYESVVGNIGDSTLDNTIVSWIVDKTLGYYTSPVESFTSNLLQPVLNQALKQIKDSDIQKKFCNAQPTAPPTAPPPKPTTPVPPTPKH